MNSPKPLQQDNTTPVLAAVPRNLIALLVFFLNGVPEFPNYNVY